MKIKILKDIAVSESGLLFNPVTGESYSVNPPGIEIMNLVREGKDLRQISEYLVSVYNVEKDEAERDVTDFLNLLNHFKLTAADVNQEA